MKNCKRRKGWISWTYCDEPQTIREEHIVACDCGKPVYLRAFENYCATCQNCGTLYRLTVQIERYSPA